jgi:hypothetical protein
MVDVPDLARWQIPEPLCKFGTASCLTQDGFPNVG